MNALKEAEKTATRMVQDARKARIERMKEAKAEADAAINQYRLELETAYQNSLSSQRGTSGAAGSTLEAGTANDIAKMNRDFNSRKSSVSQLLVDLVLKVDIKAPTARA